MSVSNLVDQLTDLATEAKKEALKVDNGNKTAGTRLRLIMQDTKALSQTIREAVLEARNK